MTVSRGESGARKTLRIIVCGGRDFSDRDAIEKVLSRLPRDTVIVVGGASGADSIAEEVATALGFQSIEVYPANWATHGKAAGPIRNQQMLDAGADIVIAFPGGRGTADMIARARAAGIPWRKVPDPTPSRSERA